MHEVLDRLVDYGYGANRRLLNSLKVFPGPNAPAVRLLAHSLAAEKARLLSLKGEDPSGIDLWPELSLHECENLVEQNHRAYAGFLQGISQGDRDWTGLVEALLEAAHDRGQVAAAFQAGGDGSMLLSVVIPVYNESATLPLLLEALSQVLTRMNCQYELIFVDDGSGDDSPAILSEAARKQPRVKVLTFSRNFGHQAAITAGLDFASGDAVVTMDADLQDPPELLPEMVDLYRRGYDVVSAQRVSREGEGLFKRSTAGLFYWLMRRTVDSRLVPEVGDFRLFSRAAVVALRSLREQHRFMRGLVAWLGLKEAIVPFHRPPRAAGATKYTVWKMARFAWTAVCSFSGLPLRLSLPFGILITMAGFLYLVYVVYATLVLHATVPGWTSLVALQVIFSGSTLVALGLLGDYIARIYEESKSRPLYVLARSVNFAHLARGVERAVVLPTRELSSGLDQSLSRPAPEPGSAHQDAP